VAGDDASLVVCERIRKWVWEEGGVITSNGGALVVARPGKLV
jgi:hypothetical protein